MVFKRFRRGGFRRKRRFGARRFAKRVARISKRVIKRMHETKRTILAGTHSIAGAGVDVLEITPTIQTGALKYNRVGNRIMYKFLTVSSYVHATNTGIGNADAYPYRMVLFTGRQPITAATDVLEETIVSTNQNNIFTPLRSEVCNVLMDKKFVLSPVNTTAGNSSITNVPVVKVIKFAKRLPRRVLYYVSSTSQPLDPQDRIYVAILGATTGATFSAHHSVRLSFIDL